MYKPSNNPKIVDLVKSYRDRRINLSDLEAIIVDGKKCCAWCSTPLTGRKYKWCSEACSNYAFAWANPQKEYGLHILLARQDFKCNSCQYDYMPCIQACLQRLNRHHTTINPDKIKEEISGLLMKWLKLTVLPQYKPEVDHIQAISKGGQAIGLENHQAICFLCHKAKTKVDNSGPRKK